jgi:RND superfamily putative drug exporter
MFAHLGVLVARRWPLVIGVWIVVVVVLGKFAPAWDDVAHDGDLEFLPAYVPSIRGERLFEQAFPGAEAKSEIVLVVERRSGRLTREDFDVADRLARRLLALSDPGERDALPFVDAWTYDTPSVGEKLTSRRTSRGQATLVVLQSKIEFMATDNIDVLERVQHEVEDVRRELQLDDRGLRIGITGSAAVGGDMLTAAAESIQNTEWTTVGMVLLILLVVYRAPLLVVIPLISMVVSVFVALHLLALLTQLDQAPGFAWWNLKVFTTTRIFIVVIVFGAGTDFCLFLIARYREELERGRGNDSAMIHALGHVGAALAGSAATTILGLGTMVFAEFGKFKNSGPSIAISLSVALAACLTLAPAMLRALGARVFWPYGIRPANKHREADGERRPQGDRRESLWATRFWETVTRVTLARPGWVLAISTLAMAPAAYVGINHGDVTYDLLSELEPDRPSVVGTRMLESHFAPGETAPVTILVHQPGGQLDSDDAKWDKINPLWDTLRKIDGVQSVRCLTRPLGDPPRMSLFGGRRRDDDSSVFEDLARARARYLSQVPDFAGDVTRFDALIEHPPFTRQAIELVDQIERRLTELSADEASPWHGAEFSFIGTTAGIRDLRRVTAADERRIQVLVIVAVSIVLLVILRRPVVCAFLIVSVLFSYYVTLGITQLVFERVYADVFTGLDWKVPLFLFVLLIAIGQDYNVFLVTRVFEEQRRRGTVEGLRYAAVRTGGIITSCGLIMAGTFVSMMTGSLRFMIELGFALSLGVMLDTFVVRPVLAPAFLALFPGKSGGNSDDGKQRRGTQSRPRFHDR